MGLQPLTVWDFAWSTAPFPLGWDGEQQASVLPSGEWVTPGEGEPTAAGPTLKSGCCPWPAMGATFWGDNGCRGLDK